MPTRRGIYAHFTVFWLQWYSFLRSRWLLRRPANRLSSWAPVPFRPPLEPLRSTPCPSPPNSGSLARPPFLVKLLTVLPSAAPPGRGGDRDAPPAFIPSPSPTSPAMSLHPARRCSFPRRRGHSFWKLRVFRSALGQPGRAEFHLPDGAGFTHGATGFRIHAGNVVRSYSRSLRKRALAFGNTGARTDAGDLHGIGESGRSE